VPLASRTNDSGVRVSGAKAPLSRASAACAAGPSSPEKLKLVKAIFPPSGDQSDPNSSI